MIENQDDSDLAVWERYYNTVAALDDDIHQTARFDCTPLQFRALIEDIIEKLDLKPFETLLDVGCGNGQIDQVLKRHCNQVFGIDLSIGLLRRATEKDQDNLCFACGSAMDLPLADNSVDKSMSYGVSCHFNKADLTRKIKEMVRVTKPGGLVFLGDNPSLERGDRAAAAETAWQKFRLHLRQNPKNETFLPFRVAWFLLRNRAQRKRQLARLPELKEHQPGQDLVGETEDFVEEEILEIATSIGARGHILEQNYRVPYARSSFDLLIEVPA